MVVLSESYVQNLEHKSTAEALTLNLAPKTYRWYVDDTHARSTSKEQSRKFQNILNKQDKHIQFTIKDENEEKCWCSSNVEMKPHSYIPPNTIISIFKGFLERATKICSEKYLREEIEYLTDIFCENGDDKKNITKDH